MVVDFQGNCKVASTFMVVSKLGISGFSQGKKSSPLSGSENCWKKLLESRKFPPTIEKNDGGQLLDDDKPLKNGWSSETNL